MSTRPVAFLLVENRLSDVGKLAADLWIAVETFGDSFARVKHGCVVASAEGGTNGRQ